LTASAQKVLVIGYGNPAREDDGLGTLAAEAIDKLNMSGVTVEVDYQLHVEDAAAVAAHDVVIFVDASVEGDAPFYFTRVVPAFPEGEFSTHVVEPQTVVALAKNIFNATCQAYVLGIRGYSFSMFTESMTQPARENLRAALDFIVPAIQSRLFSGQLQQTGYTI